MEQSPCLSCQERDRRIAVLEAENRRLTALVQQLERAGKRQAAPFRKTDEPKPDPKKPGRKPGEDYGTKAHRQPPPPEQIDEIHEAPLPDGCPDCGGSVSETGIALQYQVELIRKPLVRQFNIHIGECRCCQRRIHGRHPLQTSDALGAAAAQLGPDAQAMVTLLNKELGLSYGKLIRCLEQFSGIKLSRGGAAQTVLRGGKRCEPAYAEVRKAARGSPVVVPNETGWRVAGGNAWLHAFVTRAVTCYVVAATRGGQASEDLLGIDYAGAMIHDGWPPYDLDATNHRAEQAIRPAVVNRKVWGGNRTWWGAKAYSCRCCALAGNAAATPSTSSAKPSAPPPRRHYWRGEGLNKYARAWPLCPP